jgi:hypothetical protein
MKCELCSAELGADLRCPACGANYVPVCLGCGRVLPKEARRCPDCGGEALPGLEMTRAELRKAGLKCFMPFTQDRNYDIYFGGHNDGEGYLFNDIKGYTREIPESRVVLPSVAEGLPIHGVWNAFFCAGDDFLPELAEATFERMTAIREVVLSNGIREVMSYAFLGCAGLENLELPRSVRIMKHDFYDLFTDGQQPMGNGLWKSPVTVRYRGTEEDWQKVAVTSRFWDYVQRGYIKMEYLGR